MTTSHIPSPAAAQAPDPKGEIGHDLLAVGQSPADMEKLTPGQPPPPRSLGHIPELDGLRGVAALMVFFHHVCRTSVADGPWPWAISALWSVSAFGNSGVDLFFVLSGFLITSILLADRQKPSYYTPFYSKRVLRIVPVYAVVLLYIALTQPHSNLAILCAALFVANFSLLAHVAPVMPFWSLAIEEQFYLVWPSLVHRKSVSALLRWSVAIAVATIALRLLFAAFGHYNYFLTFLHCDGLAAGALLACLYVRHRGQGGSAWPVIRAAWGFGSLLFAVSVVLPQHSLVQLAIATAIRLTGVTLLSLGLVGTLVFATGAPVFAVLRSRLLVFFGLISYCFYLVHLYVLSAYDHRWGSPVAPDWKRYLVRLLSVLAGSVLLSTLSRYALELPAQRLRRFIPALNPPKPARQPELHAPAPTC